MTTSSLRRDIQGLRALAVLSVVIFHSTELLPGGYLGVDIFFAISGFVITGSLHKKWEETGSINLLSFYLKRMRRLLPALGFMISIVSICTFFLISPLGMQQNSSKTGIGALTLSANYFISGLTSDYFGLPATTNPFLHTWSLSVEEQFYIVFPIFLLAAGLAANRRMRIALLTLFTASISLTSFTLMISETGMGWLSSFYSPVTRVWEFGIGILAYEFCKLIQMRKLNSQIFGVIKSSSIVVLVYSLVTYSKESGYPSAKLAIPVLATGFLLALGADRRTSLVLDSRFAQFLGDRSYALYLWHWPAIVLAKYLFPNNVLAVFLSLAVSMVFTLISYRYIENPIRRSLLLTTSSVVKILAIFLIVPLTLSGSVGYFAKKVLFPKYESGDVKGFYEGDIGAIGFESFTDANQNPCGVDSREKELSKCETDIIVIGDSHANHLVPGFIGNYPNLAVNPIGDEVITNPTSQVSISQRNKVIQNKFAKIVVINKFWANSGVPESLRQLVEDLNSSGKQVVLLDDVPNFPFDSFACKYGKSIFLKSSNCDINKSVFDAQSRAYITELQKIDRRYPAVSLFNSSELFCTSESCSMVKNGVLNYLDLNHLNENGSLYLTKQLVKKTPVFCRLLSSKLGSDCQN
jgi:peptidoglycan/LPS O-acetylase OafA/YrhL